PLDAIGPKTPRHRPCQAKQGFPIARFAAGDVCCGAPCLFIRSLYNPRFRSIPGRELNGRLRGQPRGRASWSGVPCSRLLSFRAFPERARRASRWGRARHQRKGIRMPLYEHVFLTRQDASAQQVEELTAQFKAIIEQMGGKVAKAEQWGVKSLSYRLRKNRKAHFTLLNIDAPPAALNEIERQQRIS